MEKAKQAVSSFLSQDGKHKTTIDQDVRKAVVDEHVKPTQHEEVTTAVNRDVHQDHHQTVIQPLKDKEVLPEKHVHNAMPVEHKTINHGDKAEVQKALKRDAEKFKNTSTTHETTRTASAAPVIEGERTHHHVHHHVQPVIQKETVAPEVVHTTVPVHETHHNSAIHHETTTLPVKSLKEYTTGSGSIGAQATPRTLMEHDGCPKLQDKSLSKDARSKEAIHGN